ncbi:MAG: hypothetical protein K0R18_834 [Bacillales bacterium]|jgi:hypothetical protein|nr:hypothetical protein [Bacillales bacterium]
MADAFVARSLDEIRFWARIMKEHSLFIKLGLRCSDTKLIQEADHFYTVFEEIERKAHEYNVNTAPEQIKRFNQETSTQVGYIWAFKRKLLGLILTGQMAGANNFPLLIDHTSREAAYFKNRLEELNSGNLDPLPDAIINENVFFLKIMADHAKFISHLLDPSERKLIAQAKDFSHDFDTLLFQAVDLEHMAPQSHTFPLLDQMLDQNRISVKSLRDFKKTAGELIQQSRIKSIIHPLLADHVFREAERFLFIIDALENSLNQTKKLNP